MNTRMFIALTAGMIMILALGCGQPAQEQSEAFAKYGQEFQGKIAESYQESEEWWPSPPKPPAGTPNVILFLLDDTGFGHLGSFGGLIETPSMDRLAQNGLRAITTFTPRPSVRPHGPLSWPHAIITASDSDPTR